MKAEDFDRIFDDGEEDMTQYLDMSTLRRPNLEPRRVNVDFPRWMVVALDREAERLGVPRQSIIKMWIGEKLEERKAVATRSNRAAQAVEETPLAAADSAAAAKAKEPEFPAPG
jgi:hypothetical protein